MKKPHNLLRGAWRGSGLSGSSDLFGLSGSTDQRIQSDKTDQTDYFSGVFRGRSRGRKVDKISETDAIWACHTGEPTACEERQALAIVYSLTTNPYCS